MSSNIIRIDCLDKSVISFLESSRLKFCVCVDLNLTHSPQVMNESLLTLDPPRELLFKGPLGPPGPATAKLVLHNHSSTDRIGFKMKTLDPSRYVVRPSKGLIAPANYVTLLIRCKPVRDLAAFNMNRQKLMVQSLVAQTCEDTLTDLFADAQREVIYIDKIKCVFECTTENPSEAVDQPESSASIQSDQSFESVSSLTSQVSETDTATKKAPVSSVVKSSATEPTEPTTQLASENSSQTKEEPKDSSVPENETLELNPKQEEAKLTSVDPTCTKSSSNQPGDVGETNSVSGLCTNSAAVQSAPNCSSEPVVCLQPSLLNRRNVIIATAVIGGIALLVLIWRKYRL